MTLQAFFPSNELRLLRFTLIQRVEHCSLRRVNRCNFENVPALYPAHINVVIKIQGSRCGRPDSLQLGTGFGKDQPLRGERNIELLKH